MRKDYRKATRRTMGTRTWIRIDDGFSVRPCRVIDLSDSGVQLAIDKPQIVAERFSLLLSRDAAPGRPCRVKWRRGSQIGAEFVA